MNKDREKLILEALLREKKVNVKSLAAQLFTSEPSIRRDLANLEKQNLIKRVHGGAILEYNGVSKQKIPFILRELEHYSEKVIMAKRAVELIHDGDTIFLDASSSSYNLVPFLTTKNNITVITSGVKTISVLANYGITSICTGGNLINSCLSLTGDVAHQTIRTYRADICFISCRGLSEYGELSDISVEENLVRREMIMRSLKSYLLCVHEKFNTNYFHKLCTVSDLAGIITDGELPNNLKQYVV